MWQVLYIQLGRRNVKGASMISNDDIFNAMTIKLDPGTAGYAGFREGNPAGAGSRFPSDKGAEPGCFEKCASLCSGGPSRGSGTGIFKRADDPGSDLRLPLPSVRSHPGKARGRLQGPVPGRQGISGHDRQQPGF